MLFGKQRSVNRRSSAQHLNSPSRARSTSLKFSDVPDDSNAANGYAESSQEGYQKEGNRLTFNALLRMMKRRLRSRALVSITTLAVVVFVLYKYTDVLFPVTTTLQNGDSPVKETSRSSNTSPKRTYPDIGPASHPMSYLINDAERDFENVKSRQSKTLQEAVAEYRRRYKIPPPPNFDKWYALAVEHNFQLIDEFDGLFESLTPFWGLEPKVIRSRAREALGFDNNLLGVLIRDGNITKKDGGRLWQHESLDGVTKKFLQYLPDMDLCFNVYDEPRVIVPYDDLSRLVDLAQNNYMPAANRVPTPRNTWSKRPNDINDGKRIEEVRRTRFNYIVHQATWSHSRLSCPPDSAARSLSDDTEDDTTSYAIPPLGFIYNQTAFSDICTSPSLSSSYGFFDAPNSFSVAQDLFPIFSPSKISSFQDILFPALWYWYNKVKYNEADDPTWREKEDKLYWRGSTNGGYARNGGWRHQHRQGLVLRLNSADHPTILHNSASTATTPETKPNWTTKTVFRPDYAAAFDVHFSEINQCDKGDCKAQAEAFTLAPQDKQGKAWKYKYLLDMDGNAFSGRFYAFLMSRSLVFKMAIFREWHAERIRPWAHYIPLSMAGAEHLEAVRWLEGEEEGRREGERLAEGSRVWAGKTLRNVDLEIWFFRLLLEYGRVIDDDREKIGFSV